jgi:hypothetical protein
MLKTIMVKFVQHIYLIQTSKKLTYIKEWAVEKSLNTAKEEEIAQNGTDQAYHFVTEFLEEVDKSSSIHYMEEDIVNVYSSSHCNALATLRISNCLYNKCKNILFLTETFKISILDGGADPFDP